MDYQAEISRVARARIDEIRGDLDQARYALHRTTLDKEQLERRVASLEALLELAGEQASHEWAPQGMTCHAAMVAVLKDAPGGMMRAGDLAAEINRRRLYRMRDGRPVEAQQMHARVGNYPHLLTKEGTFIKLADPSAL